MPQVLISVGRCDVQYISHLYGRTGTLWDGRYKSSLVQAESDLLLCKRDIELNPVRAGMGRDASDYRWSSYRTNGLGQRDALLTPYALYPALGLDDSSRCEVYRDLFGCAREDSPLTELRMALNQDQPIGKDRFYRDLEVMTGQRRELRKRGRPRRSQDSGTEARGSQETRTLNWSH